MRGQVWKGPALMGLSGTSGGSVPEGHSMHFQFWEGDCNGSVLGRSLKGTLESGLHGASSPIVTGSWPAPAPNLFPRLLPRKGFVF